MSTTYNYFGEGGTRAYTDPTGMMETTVFEELVNLTTQATTTTTAKSVLEDPIPTDILHTAAEFELILPCIFGIFVALSLSLVVFYSKRIPYEVFKNEKEHGTDHHHQNGDAVQMRDLTHSNGFASPIYATYTY